MPREFLRIRCQRCRAPNPVGQELCDQCGTRLMLVVEPTAHRFDEGGSATTEREVVLLERLTILENHLTRFADKLQQAFDLMLKQAQNAYDNQALLQCLVSLLDEAGVVTQESLKRRWREVSEAETVDQKRRALRAELRDFVLENYGGAEKGAFAALLDEGLSKLDSGDASGGLKALEGAALLSPDNAPLAVFIGEQFFKEGKATLAASYFGRARAAGVYGPRTALTHGLALADGAGKLEEARAAITESVERGGDSFAARYALGRLAALGGDWREAAAQFKRAHAARACPESHYLLALAQHRLGRDRLALRHALKAVELDENYAAAFYVSGLILRALGDPAGARRAFAHWRLLGGDASAKKSAKGRAPQPSEEALLHSFFGAARHGGRRRLTAGDERLAKLLREDALAFAPRLVDTPA